MNTGPLHPHNVPGPRRLAPVSRQGHWTGAIATAIVFVGLALLLGWSPIVAGLLAALVGQVAGNHARRRYARLLDAAGYSRDGLPRTTVRVVTPRPEDIPWGDGKDLSELLPGHEAQPEQLQEEKAHAAKVEMVKISAEAELPYIDYESGEIWPPQQAKDWLAEEERKLVARRASSAAADLQDPERALRRRNSARVAQWLDTHTRWATEQDCSQARAHLTQTYGNTPEPIRCGRAVVLKSQPQSYPPDMFGVDARTILIPVSLGVRPADLPTNFHGGWGHNTVVFYDDTAPGDPPAGEAGKSTPGRDGGLPAALTAEALTAAVDLLTAPVVIPRAVPGGDLHGHPLNQPCPDDGRVLDAYAVAGFNPLLIGGPDTQITLPSGRTVTAGQLQQILIWKRARLAGRPVRSVEEIRAASAAVINEYTSGRTSLTEAQVRMAELSAELEIARQGAVS